LNQDPSLATSAAQLGVRPSQVCQQLLAALDSSEGRRRRRKRDTTPDSIGLSIKRELLEGAVEDDPDPQEFEGWLVRRCHSAPWGSGPALALALDIFDEWRLALTSDAFRTWLGSGAVSDDGQAEVWATSETPRVGRRPR
jgi:hypothetical protein